MLGRSILAAMILLALPAGGLAQTSPLPSGTGSVASSWREVPLGPAFARSCITRTAVGPDGTVALMASSLPVPGDPDAPSPATDARPGMALWSVASDSAWDGSDLVEAAALDLDGMPLDPTSWSGRALVPIDGGLLAFGQSVEPGSVDYGDPIALRTTGDGTWRVIEQDLPADLLIATAFVDRGRVYVAGRSGASSPTDESPRLYVSADGHTWDDLAVTGAPGAATSIVVGPDGTILLTGPRTSETGGTVGTWTRTPDGTWHDAPVATGLEVASVRSPIATSAGYLMSVTGLGETAGAPSGELWGSADGVAWQRQPVDAALGPVGSLRVGPDDLEATVFRVHPDPTDPSTGTIGTVLAHSPDGLAWTVDTDEVPTQLFTPVAITDGRLLASACDVESLYSDDAHAMLGSLWVH